MEEKQCYTVSAFFVALESRIRGPLLNWPPEVSTELLNKPAKIAEPEGLLEGSCTASDKCACWERGISSSSLCLALSANAIEENGSILSVCPCSHGIVSWIMPQTWDFFILPNIFALYTFQVNKNFHESELNFGLCIFWLFEWKYVVYQEISVPFHNALLSLFTCISFLVECDHITYTHQAIMVKLTSFHHTPWSI